MILDNRRSEVLGTELQEILSCIRCGACLNVCPVYRQVGGHAYGWVYSGPVGAVLTPLLASDHPEAAELPNASTLCGACMDACPVSIPLQDLLLTLRRRNATGRGPWRARRLVGVGRGVEPAAHLPGLAEGRRPRPAAQPLRGDGPWATGVGRRPLGTEARGPLVPAALEGRRAVRRPRVTGRR